MAKSATAILTVGDVLVRSVQVRDGKRDSHGFSGLVKGLCRCAGVTAYEFESAVDDHLRGIVAAQAHALHIIGLAFGRILRRKRISPSDAVPVRYMLGENDDIRIGLLNSRQQLVGGRTTGAHLGGE